MLKRFSGIVCGFFLASILSNLMIFAVQTTKEINVTYRDIKLSTNGTEFTPRDVSGNIVEPFIYEGTTYLPVRAVGEALGRDVNWDNDTSTVIISGKPSKRLKLTSEIPLSMNRTKFQIYKNGEETSLICKPNNTDPDTSGWYDFSERTTYLLNGKATKFTATLMPPTLLITARAKVKIILRDENDKIFFESDYIKESDSSLDIEVNVSGYERLTIEFFGATTATPNNYAKIKFPTEIKLNNPTIETTDY